MPNWKQNFTVIWISQFISIMGFTFALPFAPYYIQELGIRDPVKVKLWVSLYAAAAPLSFALISPIWGIIADRYGRRLMLLRAYFAAAIILALMGTVNSVIWLVVLRFFQGVFTGTVPAAQTLVSAETPRHRSGFALGALSGALFSGAMIGSFVGGQIADIFGYRMAFYISGGMLLIPGLLTVFLVREKFNRPEPRSLLAGFKPGTAQLVAIWPILFLFIFMSFNRTFDRAFLPLLVQDIHGGVKGASRWTGSLYALSGVAGLISGFFVGWLADRFPPAKIGKIIAFFGAILVLVHTFIYTFPLLFLARFALMFCVGGLDPLFQIWLSKVTPIERKGFVFGWATTAKSIGWVMAPVVSGLIASAFGLRKIFIGGAVFYVLLILVINMAAQRFRKSESEE